MSRMSRHVKHCCVLVPSIMGLTPTHSNKVGHQPSLISRYLWLVASFTIHHARPPSKCKNINTNTLQKRMPNNCKTNYLLCSYTPI